MGVPGLESPFCSAAMGSTTQCSHRWPTALGSTTMYASANDMRAIVEACARVSHSRAEPDYFYSPSHDLGLVFYKVRTYLVNIDSKAKESEVRLV